MSRRVDKPDTPADKELKACLTGEERQSFIMVAGAGSGKTTSLVKALSAIINEHGAGLKLRRQRIACITFTEVAAREIWDDVGNNPIVHISTIHSFMWMLVRSFQRDIRDWVKLRITEKVGELKGEAASFGPRVQQRTKDRNRREIERFTETLPRIDRVAAFSYGSGSDYAKGIVGHDDVLRLSTHFLAERKLFRSLVAQQFPFVFVDESQDTSEAVVVGLKAVAEQSRGQFCLGFFGDPMQQIYTTGIGPITAEDGWANITKQENFRCPGRVMALANSIRQEGDGLVQIGGRTRRSPEGHQEAVDGTARIFIMPADANRDQHVTSVRLWIAHQNGDDVWRNGAIKVLVIVHRMAARRLGFDNLYLAMNSKAPSIFSEGFLDATAWPLRPFMSTILPLATATIEKREFDAMTLLRASSPLLEKDKLPKQGVSTLLAKLRTATHELSKMLRVGSAATIRDVLVHVRDTKLATLDPRLLSYLEAGVPPVPVGSDDIAGSDDVAAAAELEIAAMESFLACAAVELWGYQEYLTQQSPFSTQQGIKGTEFERVLVIADDGESTHFQFSYDKYFGIKALSDSDRKNVKEGKETQVERTRRLFYVCCTRAMTDLAVIFFAGDVNIAKDAILAMKLFPADQVFTHADLT